MTALEEQLVKTGQELDELKVSLTSFDFRCLPIPPCMQHKRVEQIKEHNATVGKMQVSVTSQKKT